MGGFGSGRGQGGKDTTSDMRALDIRRLQRDGLLTQGRACGWNWLRNGETMASINIRTEADRVILDYRSRRNGGQKGRHPEFCQSVPHQADLGSTSMRPFISMCMAWQNHEQ